MGALRARGYPAVDVPLGLLSSRVRYQVPALVSGSVVVESVFSLPGLGHLAFDAALRQEQPMVMAMTLLVGGATLLGLLLSDVLHRAVDPRVELR